MRLFTAVPTVVSFLSSDAYKVRYRRLRRDSAVKATHALFLAVATSFERFAKAFRFRFSALDKLTV